MLKRWLCLVSVLAMVTGACSDDKDKGELDGAGPVDTVDAGDEVPANDTCAAPVELVFDEAGVAAVWGSTEFGTNDYAADCGGAEAPELVYKITVPAGVTKLSVDLVTDMNPVLYFSSGDCSPDSPFLCVSSKSVSQLNPAQGTQYLFVDGKTAADKGEFSLTVSIE